MMRFSALCSLASALDVPQPTSIDQIRAEFDSTEGLFLKVTSLSALGYEYQQSTTVWRSDLPLALYSNPSLPPRDSVGIIFNREKIQTQCAYPVNANTFGRTTDGERDACGTYGERDSYTAQFFPFENISGSCGQNTSAESFVSAYLNKPQLVFPSWLNKPGTQWYLEDAVCHFTDVSSMLEAQKMLLDRSAIAPAGVTPEEWLRNATGLGGGLTAYNEVIIAPTDDSAAAGIFWAHPGPFREPLPTDADACQIAAFLRADGISLPIFELAGVNVQRPFHGCWDEGYVSIGTEPRPGCLSQGIDEWNANLTAGGGKRDDSSVFRELNGTTFLELDCDGGQASVELAI